MDERSIPIDINTNKLLDWLISRRHVAKDWQNSILQIREKINNAIQDMPAHEGIIKLLSGQHINYFHCLKIIEILKETEADTKNLFGRYGSQRMKDWQDIVYSYQKDNVYLSEVAQMLIRNVSYEIPSLKKQSSKLEQSQVECEKKIKDYGKTEAGALKEFNSSCEQLGIKGKKIKAELLELVKELPKVYAKAAEDVKTAQPAIELYSEFTKYLLGKNEDTTDSLTVLKYLIENGNTTTYEYVHGQKPLKIEEEEVSTNEESADTGDSIDFGDTDSGSNGAEIDFTTVNTDSIDFGDITTEDQGEIDWGGTPEDFEIITHNDVEVTLEESGIIVEKSGMDGGVAQGEEALTILDNPKLRDQVINNLMELEAFLKLRLYEMSTENDLLSMSQLQDAPIALQMQTTESILKMSDGVNVAVSQLTNKRLQHLHNIKHSNNYIDILADSLKQKLGIVDRMAENKKLLDKKIKELREENKNLQPVIKLLVEKTKQLQKEIEKDISGKYKGRVVNIIGGVTALH